MSATTWASVQTAAGRGAIAVVAVDGPAAVGAVGRCFAAASGGRPREQPLGAIRFGRWGGDAGEEVVVCRRRGAPWPRVEVHCHGGAAAVRAVMRDLVAGGCVERPWREVVATEARGRLAGEAAVLLRHALTERAAAVLLDQAEGALEAALEGLLPRLAEGRGRQELDGLCALAPLGQRLTTPWRVVLAGAPNVGKSSLINALLGYSRAIVYDQPGTTRDVITAVTAIEGWPVALSDTAGLRESEDPTESAGVALAQRVMAGADLVVEVRDASRPDEPSVVPAELAALRLLVWNKHDLAAAPRHAGLATCAPTGEGVPELLAAIAGVLVPRAPAAGQAVPFTRDQAERLARAFAAAEAGDRAAAERIVQAML